LFGFPLVVGETTELDLYRHDGTPGVVEMRVAEIQWEGRKAFLASLRDITTRKQQEAALRTANAELEQRVQERTMQLQRLNADLQQVAYVSAHDLTEPVRMVGAYTQLLVSRYRGKLDAQAEEYMGYILEGTTRLYAQLKDLLDYIQVETVSRPLAATNCETVYAEVLEVLQPEIRTSAAVVTHDLLPTVQATQTQMALVFRHLLDNALKFRHIPPPRIHVWAERHEREWQFAVRDNGIGISSPHAEDIFHIFRRLHSRDKYPGTGIGLAICKKIVERHGGRIWVESAPEQGATFHFTWRAGCVE
jgi:light-regulated signal transduction histidine kinase (bacteriophytochrome)